MLCGTKHLPLHRGACRLGCFHTSRNTNGGQQRFPPSTPYTGEVLALAAARQHLNKDIKNPTRFRVGFAIHLFQALRALRPKPMTAAALIAASASHMAGVDWSPVEGTLPEGGATGAATGMFT